MKKILIFLALMLPSSVLAQSPQGMNEKEMRQMMEQMQQMQTCMQDVDQTQLKALEQQSRQVDAEIKALCSEGKREAAQQRAISYGMEMSRDPNLQTMRKCGEMMQGMMPAMPFTDYDKKTKNRHVCDP